MLNFRKEYFLTDYIMKVGNYTPSYLETAMAAEGCNDILNVDRNELKNDTGTINIRQGPSTRETDADSNEVFQYEFIIIPNFGFLDTDPNIFEIV